MRLLLLSPIFLGFGIAAKGILEGQDLFTLPALAPVVYNGATILGAIILGPKIGVFGVAIGVVIGAIGFLLVEVPGLVRSGMRYSLNFNPQAPRRCRSRPASGAPFTWPSRFPDQLHRRSPTSPGERAIKASPPSITPGSS